LADRGSESFSIEACTLDTRLQMAPQEVVTRPCPCGSGQHSGWENDACGAPLARACEARIDDKLAAYRADVLAHVNYDAGEPIKSDED
jgi:hypothetical protein